MTPRYSITAFWGPRRQSPEECATRFRRTVKALAAIEAALTIRYVGREVGIALATMSDTELAAFIADGVSPEEKDREGYPFYGYILMGTSSLLRVPSSVRLSVEDGMDRHADFYVNTAILNTEPLNEENAAFITFPIFKAALLALASAWDATWCAARPGNIFDFEPKLLPQRPRLRLAWMTYLSPRFAPLVTPPASAIVERVANGGLLMIATEERFTPENPVHLAVARDIEAALDPVNALPWPPDLAPRN